MIPLRDDVVLCSTPYVTFLLMIACCSVFVFQVSKGADDPTFIEQYGVIPARILNGGRPVEIVHEIQTESSGHSELRAESRPAKSAPMPFWLTMFTHMFLHADWPHMIANLWFLLLFGNNVEDRLGHVSFLTFYLFCGVVAATVDLAFEGPMSVSPMVGASGAIAGVMGAFMYFYPKARVLSVVPLMVVFAVVFVPAWLFLGFWFAFQWIQGPFAVSTVKDASIAWWAHIAGFIVGFAVAWLLGRLDRVKSRAASYTHNAPRNRWFGMWKKRKRG